MNIRYFFRYEIAMICAICALAGCSAKSENDQVAASTTGAGTESGVSQTTSPAQTVTANVAVGAASPENSSAHMSPEQVKQDLIGHMLDYDWRFDSMREFEYFNITEETNYGDVKELKAEAKLVGVNNRYRFDAVMLIVYKKVDGEWKIVNIKGQKSRTN